MTSRTRSARPDHLLGRRSGPSLLIVDVSTLESTHEDSSEKLRLVGDQKRPRALRLAPAGGLASTLPCAVSALESWAASVGATGPVFRTFDLRGQLTTQRLHAGDVARVLRRRTFAAGIQDAFGGPLAATWFYYGCCEEEHLDRKDQAGDGAAEQSNRPRLRRGGDRRR